MELKVIHTTRNCASSSCPTIYQDKEGNFIIQGFQLADIDKKDMPLPEGEDAVKVPAEFFMEFVNSKQ